MNTAEKELIHTALGGARSRTTQSVPWKKILSSGTLWNISLMYFCYSYCLAVYLDWFPTYLNAYRHFSLTQMGANQSMPLLAWFLQATRWAGGSPTSGPSGVVI